MVRSQKDWPDWWRWELDCSNPHLTKRMIDRSFSETELREMLHDATRYRADATPGRWIISTTHAGKLWEVVVEPQPVETVLVVVTAFPIG